MSAVANYEPVYDHQVAQLRIPPHSIEGESSVLGGLLLDNAAWDRIGDLLTEKDFYRAEHKLIYAAVGALINATKPADVITVYEHLQNQGKADEVGGLSYLNSLAQYVPSAANIRRYAEIVRERAILRKLIAASDEICTNAFNTQGKEVEAVLDHASGLLMSLLDGGRAGEDWHSNDKTIVAFLDQLTERVDGGGVQPMSTGLADLDEQLNGGMRPGQIVIVAARPGMGKSALALSIGEHVANKQHKPVGFFSLEMSKEELTTRKVSMLTQIHLERLLRPERLHDADWPKITQAVDTLRSMPFYTSDSPGLNINQVRSRARKLKREHGLQLLIIDYLQLMSPLNPKNNKNDYIGEITRSLKSLAKELGIPIIVLAQLSREVEKRVGGRPQLSDLRDSGEIEQDADVVLFIDRPFQRDRSMGDDWEHYAELIVAKQRNGATDSVNARYIGKNVQFLNWEGQKPAKLGRASGGGL